MIYSYLFGAGRGVLSQLVSRYDVSVTIVIRAHPDCACRMQIHPLWESDCVRQREPAGWMDGWMDEKRLIRRMSSHSYGGLEVP
jgi:hypothetical protein